MMEAMLGTGHATALVFPYPYHGVYSKQWCSMGDLGYDLVNLFLFIALAGAA